MRLTSKLYATFCVPSLAVYSCISILPITSTRSPRRTSWMIASASSLNAVQYHHWLVQSSLLLPLVPGSFLLSATENVTTGVPLVVTRLSGSLPMFPITVIVFILYHSFFSGVGRYPAKQNTASPCHGYNKLCLTMPSLLSTPLFPCKAALYIAIPLQHVHGKSLPYVALAGLCQTLQCYAFASPNFIQLYFTFAWLYPAFPLHCWNM